MASRLFHSSFYSLYFCTFTCYRWLSLIEIANGYELVYKWFYYIREKKISDVVAFVIMTNHIHCILYFPTEGFNLNKVIGNAKRFMAYDIISNIKKKGDQNRLLKQLQYGVKQNALGKGQHHRVFESSFDAKPIYSEPFFFQKLDYIHLNPVSKKWRLVDDFTDYEHSSASFYEFDIIRHFEPLHYNEIGTEM